MKSKPLVSVVIPVYNVEKYLDRCIQSVIEQTYTNLEIILVDDGSTDKSPELCDQYARKDKRIVIIHKKNGGLSSARNAGIEKSKGDYIAFIDSDDYIAPSHIQLLVTPALTYDADISICGEQVIKLGKQPKPIKKQLSCSIISKEEALADILTEHNFTVSVHSKLYKRTLFKNISFPVGKLYEDNGCTHKLILKSKRITYSTNKTYYYCLRNNSITSSSYDTKKLDYISLVDQACEEILKAYPQLLYACKNRRAKARISILRQILVSKCVSPTCKRQTEEIISHIKENAFDLIKYARINVRIAVILILINPNMLKIGNKIYERLK